MSGVDAILVATIAAKEALPNYIVGLKRNRAIGVSRKKRNMVLWNFKIYTLYRTSTVFLIPYGISRVK